jgi:hypothetical protein
VAAVGVLAAGRFEECEAGLWWCSRAAWKSSLILRRRSSTMAFHRVFTILLHFGQFRIRGLQAAVQL